MSFKKIFLLPLIALSLIGCNPNTSSSTTDSEIPDVTTSQAAPVEVKDLKSAIMRLQQLDNYLLTCTSGLEFDFASEFNSNYQYNSGINKGALVKSRIVYPFSIQNGQIINKDPSSFKHLYGNEGLIVNFDNVNVESIPSDVSTFETLKRDVAKPLMKMCGFLDVAYTKLDKAIISIKGTDLNTITIDFMVKEQVEGVGIVSKKYAYTITKVGEVKDEKIETFIKSGTLHVIDSKLRTISNIFKKDNYTMFTYAADGKTLLEAEMFDPKYFVRLFTKAAIAQDKMLAMSQVAQCEILMPEQPLDIMKNSKGEVVPLRFDDVYNFYYNGNYEQQGSLRLITRNNPYRPGFAQGGYQEVQHSIEEVWNYPSRLQALSNLDEFAPTKDKLGFTTKSWYIVRDFVNNFNVSTVFDQHGGAVELQMYHDIMQNEVTFRVIAADSGYFDFHFGKFGMTKFMPFEVFLAELEDHKISE